MNVGYRMGVAVGRVLVTCGLVTAVCSRPGVHKPETQQTVAFIFHSEWSEKLLTSDVSLDRCYYQEL